MSSYIKLIVFIVVLVSISVAIVSMDSSMDDINKVIPEISENIVQGDMDYNESVELVNEKYYLDSMSKATSAEENYNSSLNKLLDIQNRFDNELNSVHKDYINTVVTELKLKLNATENLKLSIECFEENSNYTGSNYGFEANDVMDQAVRYQNQRNEIVQDNPNLFNSLKRV